MILKIATNCDCLHNQPLVVVANDNGLLLRHNQSVQRLYDTSTFMRRQCRLVHVALLLILVAYSS